jgi:FeS assembly SUF system protein
MWKLFEQAFGTRNSESGIRDSEFRDPGLATRDSGFGKQDSERAESGSGPDRTRAMDESEAKTPGSSASQPSPPAAGTPIPAGPSQPAADVTVLEGQVKDALRTVYDPEIPINIQELGLVYDLRVESAGQVYVQMTLTAPSCPEAELIPGRVEQAIREVPGVTEVKVELVWEPPWTPQKMSEAARLQLGIF